MHNSVEVWSQLFQKPTEILWNTWKPITGNYREYYLITFLWKLSTGTLMVQQWYANVCHMLYEGLFISDGFDHFAN